MEGGPPSSDRISRVPPYSCPGIGLSRTGLSPILPAIPGRSGKRHARRWPGPRSLATTDGVSLMSFPPGTEMFQFPGSLQTPMDSGFDTFSNHRSAEPVAWIHDTVAEGGFPHSEILGSKLVRSSPRLIAAYHVLHRLSAPRHPPDALKALDRSHDRCPRVTDSLLGPSLTPSTVTIKTGSRSFRTHCLMLAERTQAAAFAATRAHSLFTMSDIRSHPLYASMVRSSLIRTTSTSAAFGRGGWWSWTGSNRRPHACKARALPTELQPRGRRSLAEHRHLILVGLGRLERPTSPLSGVRSNHLSYRPVAGSTSVSG